MLAPGDFVAVGPAFSRSPCVLRVAAVETLHRGSTPALARPIAREAGEAAALVDLDALLDASARDVVARAEGDRAESSRIVRAFLREPALPLATRILDALRPLAPAGATLDAMAAEFVTTPTAIVEACALLDRFGVLEFGDVAGARMARLTHGFLNP